MAATTEDIWEAFRGRLLGYIRARSRSPEDAEDILQEVFLKIQRRIGTLEDDARLTAWLYRVTHNTVIDYYRKRTALPVADPPAQSCDDDDGLAPEQMLAPFLKELLEELPDRYREALQLTELKGLTQQEMGTRLGLSTSGAKSRVQRGRAMLRTQLLACCRVELDRRNHVIDYSRRRSETWPEDCPCNPANA